MKINFQLLAFAAVLSASNVNALFIPKISWSSVVKGSAKAVATSPKTAKSVAAVAVGFGAYKAFQQYKNGKFDKSISRFKAFANPKVEFAKGKVAQAQKFAKKNKKTIIKASKLAGFTLLVAYAFFKLFRPNIGKALNASTTRSCFYGDMNTGFMMSSASVVNNDKKAASPKMGPEKPMNSHIKGDMHLTKSGGFHFNDFLMF